MQGISPGRLWPDGRSASKRLRRRTQGRHDLCQAGRPARVDARALSPREPSVRAYLDTCLVSGLAERDLRTVELDALRSILKAYAAGQLDLVVSGVVAEELRAMSAEKRALHEDIFNLIRALPKAAEATSSSSLMLTGVGAGGGKTEDSLFVALKAILDEADARHVFQAIKNEVDYFVTDDERSIVSRRASIEARHSIKVRLPSELVGELGLADG